AELGRDQLSVVCPIRQLGRQELRLFDSAAMSGRDQRQWRILRAKPDVPPRGRPDGVAQASPIAPPTTQDIPLAFACTNANPAPVFEGVNTFLVTSNATAVADMLSTADTALPGEGIELHPMP